MLVAIILTAVVILGGIVVVAMGRGGELARESGTEPTYPRFETAADVARYRPPAALLGYHAGATEHSLQLIARTLADRDAEIDWLRARLRELLPEGARHGGTLSGLPGSATAAVAEPAGEPATAPEAESVDGQQELHHADSAAQSSPAAAAQGEDK